MQRVAIMLAAVALGGCVPARMAGLERLGDARPLAISGIGYGRTGAFRVGVDGTAGQFRREAGSAGWETFFGETAIERRGTTWFNLAGPGVRGTIEGRCALTRSDRRVDSGRVSVTDTVAPVRIACRFLRSGQAVGSLALGEVPAAGLTVVEERRGRLAIGGTRFDIRSEHRFADPRVLGPAGARLGYVFADRDRDIAGVELTGGTPRLALPAEPITREAALIGAVALALMWEPGED